MQLPEGPVIICPPFVYIAAVMLCIKIAISKGGLGKSWKNLDPAHYILFVEDGNVKTAKSHHYPGWYPYSQWKYFLEKTTISVPNLGGTDKARYSGSCRI